MAEIEGSLVLSRVLGVDMWLQQLSGLLPFSFIGQRMCDFFLSFLEGQYIILWLFLRRLA